MDQWPDADVYSILGILNSFPIVVLNKVNAVMFSLPILTIWFDFIYPKGFFTILVEGRSPVSLLFFYRYTERTDSDFTQRLHESKPAPFSANGPCSENGLWVTQCSSSSEKVGENQKCISISKIFMSDHAKVQLSGSWTKMYIDVLKETFSLYQADCLLGLYVRETTLHATPFLKTLLWFEKWAKITESISEYIPPLI